MSYDPKDYPHTGVVYEAPKKTTMNVSDVYFQKFITRLINDNNKKYVNKDGDPKLFDLAVAYKFACELFELNFPPLYNITLPLNWKDIINYKLNISKIKAAYNSQKEKSKQKIKA